MIRGATGGCLCQKGGGIIFLLCLTRKEPACDTPTKTQLGHVGQTPPTTLNDLAPFLHQKKNNGKQTNIKLWNFPSTRWSFSPRSHSENYLPWLYWAQDCRWGRGYGSPKIVWMKGAYFEINMGFAAYQTQLLQDRHHQEYWTWKVQFQYFFLQEFKKVRLIQCEVIQMIDYAENTNGTQRCKNWWANERQKKTSTTNINSLRSYRHDNLTAEKTKNVIFGYL